MATKLPANDARSLRGDFLEQYSASKTVRKYTRETAGHGITYLLGHDYGKVYLEVFEKYLPKSKVQKGVQLWEFGCGGGMNLIYLVSLMAQEGIRLERAYGTDFSEALIEAARNEAKNDLTPEQNAKVSFCLARNENLIGDMVQGLSIRKDDLVGSFDFILGVNTIRYCHRLRNEAECVRDIFELLTPGGVCVVIDMNDRFPAFRSRLRDRLTKEKQARYLPSLEEHAHAFSSEGFEILRKAHFCWVPHSAGRRLTAMMRALSPALSATVPDRAMRSLVIARKK